VLELSNLDCKFIEKRSTAERRLFQKTEPTGGAGGFCGS